MKSKKHDQVKGKLEIAMEKARAMAQGGEPTPETAGVSAREPREAQLKEKAAKADDYYDRLLRTAAEFENYKKRAERERNEILKFGQEELISELISVLDNFERAVASSSSSPASSAVLGGVELIQKQLFSILQKNGLQSIEAVGKPFDPSLHEAIAEVEKDDCPEGTVVSEHLKGYTLNQRLLRPAAVTVSKKKRSGLEPPGHDLSTERPPEGGEDS